MQKVLRKTNKKGFTLVELVIVIAILAILAAIAIPTVSNVIKTANENVDKANAQTVELALKSANAEAIADTWTLPTGKTADTVTVPEALTHEGLNFTTLASAANLKTGTGFYYGTGTNNKGKIYVASAASTTTDATTDLLETDTTLSDYINGIATA